MNTYWWTGKEVRKAQKIPIFRPDELHQYLPGVRLSNRQLQDIRRKSLSGRYTVDQIGRIYGLSPGTIKQLVELTYA